MHTQETDNELASLLKSHSAAICDAFIQMQARRNEMMRMMLSETKKWPPCLAKPENGKHTIHSFIS